MSFLFAYWWIVIPGIILGIYAQIKLMSTYSKYSKISTARGLTGAAAARAILDQAGLNDVSVNEIPGQLTDHYDPTKRALFLSTDIYNGDSLASVGVAAHESGHAIQHQEAYAPLQIRMALVPITNFASFAWSGIILLGFIMGQFRMFFGIAILIFAIISIFQLVTLPVEFDASSRAKKRLYDMGLIQPKEREGVSKVLSAAAMTYVAALVSSLLQLLQYVMISRDRD
jgi:Zn-dependent membrane protease YugP